MHSHQPLLPCSLGLEAVRDLEPRPGIFLSFVSYFKAADWFLTVFPRWALSAQSLDSS